MTEQRHSPRVKTFKGGRIVSNNGSSSIDCMIRDISVEGAKLVVETTVGLPEEFLLVFNDGQRRRCGVKRRKLKELGVIYLRDGQ